VSREPEARHPTCQLSAPQQPNVVETARKRAALLTDAVSHLARCRTALSKLAALERRHRNSDRADEVEDICLSLNEITERFGIDADDAHAEWSTLRRKGEAG
jgi:hypothetical protein